MTLKEQIEKDFIESYKAQDELKTSTLRMLKSAIKNKEIALGKELPDAEMVELISKEIKQRHDSIEEYKKGNRPELAKREEKEIEIISRYLPEQLSEQEIIKIIENVIWQTNATGPQDMGKVMSKVIPQTKGRADGSLVARIVKEKLSG